MRWDIVVIKWQNMISLIHPSRGRPQRAYETARKFLDNSGCDIEYILSVDTDDSTLPDYVKLFSGLTIEINHNISAIDAANKAAKVSTGNIIIQIADDWDCPPLWGKQIIDATLGKEDWILKTPDGTQDWLMTLPIMDRTYYNRFHYIYQPEYLHMFADTEMSCVADITGRRITANIPFKHNHYSVTKTAPDQTSRKADATWNHGERLFMERSKKNFDLPLKDLRGRVQNNSMTNWMRSKGLRV